MLHCSVKFPGKARPSGKQPTAERNLTKPRSSHYSLPYIWMKSDNQVWGLRILWGTHYSQMCPNNIYVLCILRRFRLTSHSFAYVRVQVHICNKLLFVNSVAWNWINALHIVEITVEFASLPPSQEFQLRLRPSLSASAMSRLRVREVARKWHSTFALYLWRATSYASARPLLWVLSCVGSAACFF